MHLPLVWKGLKKDTVVGLFVYHQDHAKRCVDLTIFLPSDWLFRDKNENSEKELVLGGGVAQPLSMFLVYKCY